MHASYLYGHSNIILRLLWKLQNLTLPVWFQIIFNVWFLHIFSLFSHLQDWLFLSNVFIFLLSILNELSKILEYCLGNIYSTKWCKRLLTCLIRQRTFLMKSSSSFDSTDFPVAQLSRTVEYTPTASLQRGKTPTTNNNECPGYDTKQSDDEVPVMLELWGMQSTSLLPSLPGPLLPGVVVPEKGPIYGLNRTKPWFLELTIFCIWTGYLY